MPSEEVAVKYFCIFIAMKLMKCVRKQNSIKASNSVECLYPMVVYGEE